MIQYNKTINDTTQRILNEAAEIPTEMIQNIMD